MSLTVVSFSLVGGSVEEPYRESGTLLGQYLGTDGLRLPGVL
jgi:hypothetical protein